MKVASVSRGFAVLALSLAAAGVALPSAAHAQDMRPGEVLVRWRDGLPAAERERALGDHGLVLERPYPRLRCDLVRTAAGVAIPAMLERLAQDSRVARAQPNFIYTGFAAPQISPQDAFLDPNALFMGVPSHQYNAWVTKLPSLWRSSAGGVGQVIAIVDSGVDPTHPEFAGRLLPGYDFINGDADASDDNGHGTNVAGIAAAAKDGLGSVGAAPLATILPVKVLAANNSGTTASVVSGIDWAVGHTANIINLSLGQGAPDELLREAIANAYAAGCVIVASSGNCTNGAGAFVPCVAPGITYPAAYEEVIAVGAVDSTTAVWASSKYGPEVDVVGPGVNVWNTVPIAMGTYAPYSGTSMASPFVAGVCALLREQFPGIEAWELESFLRKHARSVDGLAQGAANNKDGYGMLCFGSLMDFGNGALGVASSANHFYEWLGADVTGESSTNDVTVIGANDGDDGQPDLDGVTNLAGEDGADDGLFPASHPRLPFLPQHLQPGGHSLDIDLSVGDRTGPRYNNVGEHLRVQTWIDWNSSNVFDAAEQPADTTSSPSGWPSNTRRINVPFVAPNDHFRGNPLRCRTRVDYSLGGAKPGAVGAQSFGEVEDGQVLNFVEDFDSPDFHAGVYATLQPTNPYPDGGGWVIGPDASGTGFPTNHGQWHYARTDDICQPTQVVDKLLIVPDQALDLRELTTARLRMRVIHGVCPSGCPGFDNCRLGIRRGAAAGGPFTEFTLQVFGQPDFCAGQPYYSVNLDIDLAAYLGYFVQFVVHHNTDMIDHLIVDDVIVYGYDGRLPQAPSLGGSITPAGVATANWNHPNENNPTLATTSGDTNVHRGAIYGARLSGNGGAVVWPASFRLTPRDFANAVSTFPIVGNAATAATAKLLAPSVMAPLALMLREEDEVANLGPGGQLNLTPVPIRGVDVVAPPGPLSAAPGASLGFDFTTTNTGNATDAFAFDLTDSQNPDWVDGPLAWVHVLAPGQSVVDHVVVEVPAPAPIGAGVRVTLTATSLSDPNASDFDFVDVAVTGGGAPIGAMFCFGDGSGTPCPCGNSGAPQHGCANSSGGGAVLSAFGTPSVAADSLLLVGTEFPSFKNALFFQGLTPIAGGAGVAFYDGLKCVGTSVIRFSLQTSTGDGFAAYGAPAGDVPISIHGLIPPAGALRHYQVWYRDSTGPCGTGTNWSTALSVTWTP